MQNKILINAMHFIFLVYLTSCSSTIEVPKDFKKIALMTIEELNLIEKIPLENINRSTDNDSREVTLSFKNRSKYVADNIERYNKLFVNFEQILDSIKQTKWYDDALFIRAYLMLKISTLNIDEDHVYSAILYMTTFLNLNDECKLEKWTKDKIENVLWNRINSFFSDSVSEKRNLNQFFYIARASLYESFLNDNKKAIDNYKKALKINSKSVWGQQAQLKINQPRSPGSL